jgi:FkbM family methyltransferase
VDRNLIFDLGLHHGYDTEFYLNKGFKVIALEANPAMIQHARGNPTIKKAEEDGRLGIVPMALWRESGQPISFYVSEVKDDWSSVQKSWAEKGTHKSREISVATITLDELFAKLGLITSNAILKGSIVFSAGSWSGKRNCPPSSPPKQAIPRFMPISFGRGTIAFKSLIRRATTRLSLPIRREKGAISKPRSAVT